jgi:hypothetical protein
MLNEVIGGSFCPQEVTQPAYHTIDDLRTRQERVNFANLPKAPREMLVRLMLSKKSR